MAFRARRQAQRAVVILFFIFYALLLVIWVTSPSGPSIHSVNTDHNWDSSNSDNRKLINFGERAPRSVADYRNDIQNISLDLLDKIYSKSLTQTDNNLINNSVNYIQKRRKTILNDVFISVKTTQKFHSTRLNLILNTWFNLAKEQTYFFSDANDHYYNQKSGGHLINTNCSSSHNRKALCCKMSVEFDTFIDSNKRWFCHFDDDNYVNVPQLVQLLRNYDPLEDWYLGKPSIRQPLEIVNRDNKASKISFWFATGGAGFCLSRALALKMIPIASGGKFISIGEKIRLPDDVTLGYIVEHILSKKLTVIDRLHSHLEPMKFLKNNTLSQQITFSYSRFDDQINTLSIDGAFDRSEDQTRFLSLHCHLFPKFSSCKQT